MTSLEPCATCDGSSLNCPVCNPAMAYKRISVPDGCEDCEGCPDCLTTFTPLQQHLSTWSAALHKFADDERCRSVLAPFEARVVVEVLNAAPLDQLRAALLAREAPPPPFKPQSGGSAEELQTRLDRFTFETGIFKAVPARLVISGQSGNLVRVTLELRVPSSQLADKMHTATLSFGVDVNCSDMELKQQVYKCAERTLLHELAEGLRFDGDQLYNPHRNETPAVVGLLLCVECGKRNQAVRDGFCADCWLDLNPLQEIDDAPR